MIIAKIALQMPEPTHCTSPLSLLQPVVFAMLSLVVKVSAKLANKQYEKAWAKEANLCLRNPIHLLLTGPSSLS